MSQLACPRIAALQGACARGLAVLVLTGFVAGTQAAVPGGVDLPTTEHAQQHDAAFLRDALQHSEIALRAARLAMARSHDPRVRQFADRVQREHAAVVARLDSLAAGGGGASASMQADPESYAGLRGVAFDRKFVDDRIAQARAAIALFTAEASAGGGRPVARFAAETLPMLRRHLAAAEALQAQFELRRRNFADPAD